MNTIINVECVDQDLIITNAPTIASGGICENFVSFKFCSKWDGFSKTAVFYQNEKNVYYALIDSQNQCEIPHEVTLNEGTLHFGVFGVNGDTRRTSKVEKIRIHKGAWTKDMHPSDPTPDIYTQLLSELSAVNELLNSFLNGTSSTPVGNAKTLEGHGADYFATALALQNIVNGTTTVGNALKLNGQDADKYYSLYDAIELTENTDFNNLTTAGNYKFRSGIVSTLINAPFSDVSGGVLKVEVTSAITDSTTWLKQTVIKSQGGIFERQRTSSGWEAWRKTNDADTVDGKHAKDLVQYLGVLPTENTIISDYKYPNAYEAVISTNLGIEGLPNAYWHVKYFCRHNTASDGYGFQMFFPLNNSTEKIYFRTSNNAKWSEPRAIIDSNGGTLTGTLSLREFLNVYADSSNAGTYSSFIQNSNGTHVRHVTDANNFDEFFIKQGSITYAKMVNGAWSQTDIHHDGNSAKLIISDTPLTEDGAVRVW